MEGHRAAGDELLVISSTNEFIITPICKIFGIDNVIGTQLETDADGNYTGNYTGIPSLKIKHNNMIGYYVETPQAAGETFLQPPLNSLFVHRQTMAGAMRFSTVELGELEAKIASAAAEFDNVDQRGAYIAAGLVLFVLTFVVNAAARAVVAKNS